MHPTINENAKQDEQKVDGHGAVDVRQLNLEPGGQHCNDQVTTEPFRTGILPVRQGIGEHRDPNCRRYSDEQCCPFRHSSDQTAAHVFCKCAATAAIFVTCVTTQDESAEVTLLKLLLPLPSPARIAPRRVSFARYSAQAPDRQHS